MHNKMHLAARRHFLAQVLRVGCCDAPLGTSTFVCSNLCSHLHEKTCSFVFVGTRYRADERGHHIQLRYVWCSHLHGNSILEESTHSRLSECTIFSSGRSLFSVSREFYGVLLSYTRMPFPIPILADPWWFKMALSPKRMDTFWEELLNFLKSTVS